MTKGLNASDHLDATFEVRTSGNAETEVAQTYSAYA